MKILTLVLVLLIATPAFALTIEKTEPYGDKVIVSTKEYSTQPIVDSGLTNEQIIQKLTVDTWGDVRCPYTWVEIQEGASWSVPEELTLEERIEALENRE